MRKFFTFLLLTLSLQEISAQVPQRISYQAIVRNSSNALVTSSPVGIRISILQGSATGTVVYAERHNTTTNENGLFTIEIGGGTVENGIFMNIQWANGPFYIKAETDPTGGTNYTITGTTQLLSVPYSLYANKAGNGLQPGTQAGQILYWDGTKWTTLPKGTNGQTLKWCNDTLTWGACTATTITQGIEDVTWRSARVFYAILNDGGGIITESGFIWSKGTNPQYPSDSLYSSDPRSGYYSSYLLNLEPSTVYYVRSFAKNEAGISYGSILNFTTKAASPAPIILIDSVKDITTTSANIWATVTNFQATEVNQTGFVWDTLPNPSLERRINSSHSGYGLSSFTSTLENLTPGTTYYVRAYADNEAGTFYSNDVSFKTDTIPIPPPPIVNIDSVGNITTTSAKVWATVSGLTGASTYQSGFVWDTIPDPSINRNLNYATKGSVSAGFNTVMQNLSPCTTYYVKAYASDIGGLSYSNEVSFKTDTIPVPPPPPPAPSSVTDFDGNMYPVVKIGNKHWTAKNLDVSHYRNGDPIPQVQDSATWANLTTGAWCYYENKTENGAVYGKLYNWYAVTDPRGIAPTGWHVPTQNEWKSMIDTLGGPSVAGGKLKSTTLWNSPNTGATNSSGFTALPGGQRYANWSTFAMKGDWGTWWTSTKADPAAPVAFYFYLTNGSQEVLVDTYYEIQYGYSIRLIWDH